MKIVKILLPEYDPVVNKLKFTNEKKDFKDKLGVELIFKQMDLEAAAKELNDGNCDVVISGAVYDSVDVIRAAIFHINKPRGLRQLISSFFIMEKDGQPPLFFADCAVHEFPDAEQLCEIAEQTATSVMQLGYDPIVAFLSLSTFGSAAHLESVKKIAETAELFKQKNPNIISYGEIQVDAALDPAIFAKKAKGKNIELVNGKMPNVFIFPDGTSGNIAYKLVERLAIYTAVGPMLNGVELDWHDLSRGVSYEGLIKSVEYAAKLYRARNPK